MKNIKSLITITLFLFPLLAFAQQTTPAITLASIAYVDGRAAIKESNGDVSVVKEGDVIENNNWQVKQIMPNRILLSWQGDKEFIGNMLFVEVQKNGKSKKTLLTTKPEASQSIAISNPGSNAASGSATNNISGTSIDNFSPSGFENDLGIKNAARLKSSSDVIDVDINKQKNKAPK